MPRRISRRVQRQFDVLRRATRWPVWADLATRLGVAFLLIGVVVLVHWSDRAGLQDSYDGHVGFLDVVYFTMISVTTTGFGDITPVSDRSRLIEAVIVTPIRIAALDRKTVVSGKRVPVRVDLGGHRSIKPKTTQQ